LVTSREQHRKYSKCWPGNTDPESDEAPEIHVQFPIQRPSPTLGMLCGMFSCMNVERKVLAIKSRSFSHSAKPPEY